MLLTILVNIRILYGAIDSKAVLGLILLVAVERRHFIKY